MKVERVLDFPTPLTQCEKGHSQGKLYGSNWNHRTEDTVTLCIVGDDGVDQVEGGTEMQLNPLGSPSTALVYVSLGNFVSPQLNDFAAYAAQRISGARAYLITDTPGLWSQFPGELVKYRREDVDPIIRRLRLIYPEKVLYQGGFWMATLERIFALEALSDELDETTEIVHFESDVMSFLTDDHLRAMRKAFDRPAVPLESTTAGCASVMYSPNLGALLTTLSKLAKLLKDSKTWLTDMQLLGLAAKRGIVTELPTRLEDALSIAVKGPNGTTGSYPLIFDATALGMYVFGLDPIHTEGTVRPGYLQQDFGENVVKFFWACLEMPSSHHWGVHVASESAQEAFIANIHIHSKINPGSLRPDSAPWAQFLEGANTKDWADIELARTSRVLKPAETFSDLRFSDKLHVIFSRLLRTLRW